METANEQGHTSYENPSSDKVCMYHLTWLKPVGVAALSQLRHVDCLLPREHGSPPQPEPGRSARQCHETGTGTHPTESPPQPKQCRPRQ